MKQTEISEDNGSIHPSDWHAGRVGMLYRDLTPDELRSRIVVSHIRLPFEGEVPDYVHYHKVEFQLIYCLKGRIKVVYEDQGEPFWLETGDCVLQPPEIRHRVLECDADSEVIEVTSPANHETCTELEITLPTETLDPRREFGGQRFVRHIAARNAGNGIRDLELSNATAGNYSAVVEKKKNLGEVSTDKGVDGLIRLEIPLNSDEVLSLTGRF